MGKIYFNIENEGINYLEEDFVSKFDIPLSEMANKIILVSMNNIKKFDCFDPLKNNEDTIKNLIKGGYRPVNDLMKRILTQLYTFCPDCGEDIDIESYSDILISDAGTSLSNIVSKNVYPAKEITCEHCGNQSLYYYDLYANEDDKNDFAKRAVSSGSDIYIKYRHIIDGGNANAYIPVIFDFAQLLQFFNRDDGRLLSDKLSESDLQKELLKGNDSKIIGMLFNRDLQEILETEEEPLVDNMRVEFKPVELGRYDKYVTKSDFETIEIYKSIGDNQEKLLKLILE